MDDDLRRYSDALESRRIQLGMSKAELARRSKVSESLIYKAVAGTVHVGDDSSARIDEALGWPTGTLQAVAAGEMTPPTDLVTAPDRLERLERQVDEARRELDEYKAVIESLNEMHADIAQVLRLTADVLSKGADHGGDE